ncbi:MAG: hypothetical protein RR068_06760, partial [Hafnia sp.]
ENEVNINTISNPSSRNKENEIQVFRSGPLRHHIACPKEIYLLLSQYDIFIFNILSFPCTQCGLCCRHVDRSIETLWLDRGDGICTNFNTDSKVCNVYETRPLVCRIDEMYPHFSSAMTLPGYYQANADVCNVLQTEHAYPELYRINLRKN